MAVSDIYTYHFTPTLSATGVTAVGSIVAGTTVRLWVVGIYVEVQQTTAVANNSILFQFARPANSPTGTTTVSGAAHDFSAPAGIGTGYSAWSTAPTLGVIMTDYTLTQATGSQWEDYPPTGYEYQIPAIANGAANNGLHMFANPTVATSTPVIIDLIVSQ